jgi:3'-phosphoadenosine 5'-phosphosulfate sulfotransferase (PAPS reductase)/FAD synthetase
LVISAEGIRAQESAARAKRAVLSVRAEITAAALQHLPPGDALAYRSWKQRLAFTWNPLHKWVDEDVWSACGTSCADLARRRQLYTDGYADQALHGWPGHPAYVYGSSRLSCALCVLAKRNDLLIGARHNPDLFQSLLAMEQQSGCTFKHGWSLRELLPDLQGEAIHDA